MSSPLTNLKNTYSELAPQLWARRWLVIGAIWALAVIGTGLVAVLPNQYVSRARVYIDTDSLLKPLLQGLTVQVDIQKQVEMMRQTLLSRPNLDQLIRMTDLDLGLNDPAAWDRAAADLEKQIKIVPESRQLFTISTTNSDPDLAQKIVGSLLQIFVEQNVGTNRRDIEKSQKFINEQIAEYERRLGEIEAKVTQFKQVHAEELLDKDSVGRELQQAESDLRQAESEAQGAVWTLGQLNLELARTPKTVAPSLAPGGGATVEDPQAELATLRLKYTDSHPDVIEMKRRIEVAGKSAGGVGGVPNPVYTSLTQRQGETELHLNQLRQQVTVIQGRIARLRGRLGDFPAIDLERAQLDRDYTVLRDNYQQLIARRESARLAQEVDDHTQGVDFRVVEPPARPAVPAAPNRILFLVLAAVISVAGGTAIGVAAVRLSGTFANAAALRRRFDVDVIGSITAVSRDLAGAVRWQRAEIASMAALLVMYALATVAFAQSGGGHAAPSAPAAGIAAKARVG